MAPCAFLLRLDEFLCDVSYSSPTHFLSCEAFWRVRAYHSALRSAHPSFLNCMFLHVPVRVGAARWRWRFGSSTRPVSSAFSTGAPCVVPWLGVAGCA
jgi:hypothetical protein